MAALPKSSTVVVHAVIDGKHSAMIFTEVDVETWPSRPFTWDTLVSGAVDQEYVISGAEGYVFREGDSLPQVYVTAIAHQAEVAAEMRKERDEAVRERDAALRDVASLKESILLVVDPDSFSDEDDDDFCEQCYDYH